MDSDNVTIEFINETNLKNCLSGRGFLSSKESLINLLLTTGYSRVKATYANGATVEVSKDDICGTVVVNHNVEKL